MPIAALVPRKITPTRVPYGAFDSACRLDVIAILQTGPLILILGAAFLLRERISPVLVTQPSGSGFPPGALLACGAALLGAARDFIGRGVPISIR
jgi:hypothetical protein